MMNETQLKEEIKLFKENLGSEAMLKSVRSLLLGLEISDEQKKQIQAVFSNKTLLDIFRRRVNQRVTDDADLGSISDYWMQSTDKLIGGSGDIAIQTIKIGAKLINHVKKMEELLQDPFQEPINFGVDFEKIDSSVSFSETTCSLVARNLFIRSVDFVLRLILSLVQSPEETPEQTVERLKKDSTK
jgi:hypothetical protein